MFVIFIIASTKFLWTQNWINVDLQTRSLLLICTNMCGKKGSPFCMSLKNVKRYSTCLSFSHDLSFSDSLVEDLQLFTLMNNG